MAQNLRPRDDCAGIYGVVRQRRCSIRVPVDTFTKNAEQSFGGKSGFLGFHHDDYYVSSYGDQLLL